MRALIYLLALCVSLAAGTALGEPEPAQEPAKRPVEADFPGKASSEAKIFRGSIVYQNYCVLCHGVNADGNGRAAKLHNPRPANLRISPFSDQYKEKIIRGGGKSVGRSPDMPPWGEELTDEQIADVIAYLRASLIVPPAK